MVQLYIYQLWNLDTLLTICMKLKELINKLTDKHDKLKNKGKLTGYTKK